MQELSQVVQELAQVVQELAQIVQVLAQFVQVVPRLEVLQVVAHVHVVWTKYAQESAVHE